MPNYNETQISGDTRRRAYRIEIDNHEGKIPVVTIATQDRINLLNGSREYISRGVIFAQFDQRGLEESFPLVNIETGESMGASMSGLDLMAAVQSWVLHQMVKSDPPAKTEPDPEPEPEPEPDPEPVPEPEPDPEPDPEPPIQP